jgi:hypothetical protein
MLCVVYIDEITILVVGTTWKIHKSSFFFGCGLTEQVVLEAVGWAPEQSWPRGDSGAARHGRSVKEGARGWKAGNGDGDTVDAVG